MSVRVHIPTPLRQYTQSQATVEASGASVQTLLEDLGQRFPGIGARLFDNGQVRRFINVYLNDEDIRYLDNLSTPVKPGDEVSIIPAVAGGSMADLDRYSRQMRFAGMGEEGQRRLLASRVTICGCGALGSVAANALARAGVGHLRIVDRDFVETNNLQRQVLFDESDVANNLPKAEAAARRLRRVNSEIVVEPVVAHVDRRNVVDLIRDADVVLDGTDNFEVRYLINDAAVKLEKPWVYGGCLASHGQTMTIVPGRTPCLRCVFEAAPTPGEGGTCESAGVLSPIVNVIASFQVAEAVKILTGNLDRINPDLLYFDVWENTFRRIKIAPLRGRVDCPCCRHGRWEWLDGAHGSQTTQLCGRNAVQVAVTNAGRLDFPRLAASLDAVGSTTFNEFLLRFETDGYHFTVFPDGRAIIKGTDDEARARTLYARYIGH